MKPEEIVKTILWGIVVFTVFGIAMMIDTAMCWPDCPWLP